MAKVDLNVLYHQDKTGWVKQNEFGKTVKTGRCLEKHMYAK